MIKNYNEIMSMETLSLERPKDSKLYSVVKKALIAIGIFIGLFIIVQFINASKYSMVVNVKSGENAMGINPLGDKLDFGDLSRNNGMTRYITLASGGSMPTYVSVWKFGEISDLVKIDSSSFTLKPGEEKKVSFEINIPASAQFRQYSGWVVIFRLPKFI